MADTLPLVKGSLDALILKALVWTPMHGFEITSWLEARSGGTLDVQDSALYQALHRLEERGLVVAEWGITENNQRARYYRVTAPGRAHLATETARWVRYAETVTGILTASERRTARRA
jgi:PadR family transcriptional regulator PadR